MAYLEKGGWEVRLLYCARQTRPVEEHQAHQQIGGDYLVPIFVLCIKIPFSFCKRRGGHPEARRRGNQGAEGKTSLIFWCCNKGSRVRRGKRRRHPFFEPRLIRVEAT